ncbi:MAG: alpha-ribazole phosphatase [Methylococcaceae bacterium]|nr:alpha-ribazole phosphatase [Methylococcaceae bacterium]
MDIYLIRHTKTATEQGLCYGRSNVALSSTFIQDAKQIQARLPALGTNYKVYSSPLSRCLQLAELFSQSVITDARLLELDFGDWENRSFDAINPDELSHWTQHFVEVGPPNGESFASLCERAGNFWQELLLTPSEQVIIITHAGVIRALLAHILKLPLGNAFQFRIDSGSIHKFQYRDNYTLIHFLNQSS